MSARPGRAHLLVSAAASRPPARGELRAFSTCRNERLRLPAFLDHYRRLGVHRFFMVDHDSSDGTTDYLIGQPDVHVFRTADRYSESRSGTDWLHALLMEFGVGTWCLTVDVDELLVYPGSERAPLCALTEYLDRRGYEALSCLLLDLYPGCPLAECAYEPGGDILAAAPYFDAAPYERSPVDLCPNVLIRGGVRERIFFPGFRSRGVAAKTYAGLCHQLARRLPFLSDAPFVRASRRQYPPCLTKVPLVRWDEGSAYVYSTHFVSRKALAPETGALLHFKFLQDFHSRAIHEAARAEHYDDAFEYRLYAEKLGGNTALTFLHDASMRYEDTTQLVRLGLIRETQPWIEARDDHAALRSRLNV